MRRLGATYLRLSDEDLRPATPCPYCGAPRFFHADPLFRVERVCSAKKHGSDVFCPQPMPSVCSAHLVPDPSCVACGDELAPAAGDEKTSTPRWTSV